MPGAGVNISISTSTSISMVIAVYNDWTALQGCLQSITEQTDGRDFEVIVVDDGSTEAAPEAIRRWIPILPLTIVRQPHGGISAARNCGIRNSRGAVLLFVDADCRLQANCLAALSSAIADSAQHDCFQLRLTGNCGSVAGRAEQLRLITFQEHSLQPDGRIRYLNTAGFAIRRARAETETALFDPAALRGEDTLLLANLIQRGELPLFVPAAIVQHDVSLSLMACLRKDIRSAYLEGRTYHLIAAKGIRIRVTPGERLKLLSSLWKTAGQPSIGRTAWFVLVGRQALQRMISVLYKFLRLGQRHAQETIS